MYVCICNNVTERDIERAVGEGARSVDCLVARLAVSTSCGQCRDEADACLTIALARVEPAAPAPVVATLGDAALRLAPQG